MHLTPQKTDLISTQEGMESCSTCAEWEQAKVRWVLFHEMLFVDYAALVAHTAEAL